MKPVYQTVFDHVHGNCLQACVASILELELDDVPPKVFAPRNWLAAYNVRLKKIGVSLRYSAEDVSGYHIKVWVCDGDDGMFAHAIVYDGQLIAHDPYKDRPPISPFTHYALEVVSDTRTN